MADTKGKADCHVLAITKGVANLPDLTVSSDTVISPKWAESMMSMFHLGKPVGHCTCKG